MLRILLPTLLIGCGSIEGAWEGSADCGAQVEGAESSLDLSLDLEPVVEGEYAGTGGYRMEIDAPESNESVQDMDLSFEFDVTVLTDGPGEQRLELESATTDCDLTLDGEQQDPEAAGYPCDGEELFEGWTFDWDGYNEIRFEADDCEGTLERN